MDAKLSTRTGRKWSEERPKRPCGMLLSSSALAVAGGIAAETGCGEMEALWCVTTLCLNMSDVASRRRDNGPLFCFDGIDGLREFVWDACEWGASGSPKGISHVTRYALVSALERHGVIRVERAGDEYLLYLGRLSKPLKKKTNAAAAARQPQ